MKKLFRNGLVIGILSAMVLALCACSGQQTAAPAESTEAAPAENTEAAPAENTEAVPAENTGAAADEYADYIGYQFAGEDPWGGHLSITIRSIQDGKLAWTFTDVFDDATLYQELTDTPIEDGVAKFQAEGTNIENEAMTFQYAGTLTLKDGKLTVAFESGDVMTESSEGGSSARHVEALEEAAKTIDLEKEILDK